MNINKNLTIEETFNLAVKNHQEGKTDIAQELYDKILEIDPNYTNALSNLSVIFFGLGDYKKAIIFLEKAIKINPNYADAHNNLGVLAVKVGNIHKAKKCHEKAIEINPNYADAHCNLGLIFKDLGETQKAKDHYEKAIEIDPNHFEAYGNLGHLLYETDEPQKAITYFQKSIEIKPGISNILSGLLKSLDKTNNQSILFKELDSIIEEGKINAVIGSIFSRTEVKYGVKKENPFCNDPLSYVLEKNLIEKYDFKNVIVDCAHNILKNDSISNRAQALITNGYQTAGDLFANDDFNTKEIQKIIHAEIEQYRLKFKDSEEGFIKNWPTNYSLMGWIINLKKGGKLAPHMHDFGWLSGSIYVNVPPKKKTNSGNLVVCIGENGNDKNNKSIDVVTGSLCLFPSSLHHYTIPFESEEERIVLAFDMNPK
tara:strand:- start:385 stop:1665 length:1281 start_codon:yes stop_codon:yes gene_type:complete